MSSPQVKQWLDDGTRLQEEMASALQALEDQQRELQEKLEAQRLEVAVMNQILERARNPDPSMLEEANDMSFNSKAGSPGMKNQKREEWHPGV